MSSLIIRNKLENLTISLSKFYDLEMSKQEFYFFKHHVVEYTMRILDIYYFLYKGKYKLKYILPSAYSLSFKYLLDFESPDGFINYLQNYFYCDFIKNFEIIILNTTFFTPFKIINCEENRKQNVKNKTNFLIKRKNKLLHYKNLH